MVVHAQGRLCWPGWAMPAADASLGWTEPVSLGVAVAPGGWTRCARDKQSLTQRAQITQKTQRGRCCLAGMGYAGRQSRLSSITTAAARFVGRQPSMPQPVRTAACGDMTGEGQSSMSHASPPVARPLAGNSPSSSAQAGHRCLLAAVISKVVDVPPSPALMMNGWPCAER